MPVAKITRAAAKTAPAAQRRAAAPDADVPADPFDFQHDSLGYALRLAQMRAYSLFFEMLTEHDLTPARLTALSIIAMTPELNQSNLAQRLDISGPSVLKVVDALASAGYVERTDCADDRRRYLLSLTPEGRRKLAVVREATEAYEARLAAGLTAAERVQLMGLLARVGIAS
jgi:DNA-binding MarR family transcriptional regulator